MSIVASFPPSLEVKTFDNVHDYTSGEKCIGLFLDRYLYQTTIAIPMSSIPTTGLTTYNYFNHGIADIDVPLFIRDITLKSAGTSSAFSKLAYTMQANSSNTSQWHLYIERFTKTQLWIKRGTSATNEADTLYVTVQYFKRGE